MRAQGRTQRNTVSQNAGSITITYAKALEKSSISTVQLYHNWKCKWNLPIFILQKLPIVLKCAASLNL